MIKYTLQILQINFVILIVFFEFSFGKIVFGQENEKLCVLPLENILEKYVERRGGAKALEELQSLRIKSQNHEGRWNPHFEYSILKPNLMVMKASYIDGDVIWEGFDGKKAWEKLKPHEPAVFVTGDAEKGLSQGGQSPVFLFGLHQMEGLGHKLTFIGCQEIDGVNYYVIYVLANFGTDIEYFINAKSFLLERARSKRPLHPTIDPTVITIEERWDDFRFVDGVLYPFEYFQWNVDEGKLLSFLAIKSIEVNSINSLEIFSKPD